MKKSLTVIIIASLLLGGCASFSECLKNTVGVDPITAPICLVIVPAGKALEDSKERKAAQHQSDEWEQARQQAQPQADTSETPAPVAEEK